MQFTTRTVKVSIPYIQEAMATKESFEALAFCLMVKLNITSSSFHHATYRRLKEATHIGSDKLKQLVSYCTEHGLLWRQGDSFQFGGLCKEGASQYKFKFRYVKRQGKQLNFFITLAKVKDMLRRAILANHIKKVENIRQTTKLTSNPETLQDYRNGKRLARRLVVWGCDFFISNKRLAELAQCSISKVRSIKSGMMKADEISRTFSNTLICENASDFNVHAFGKYVTDEQFLFEHNGMVYRHNPNVYQYTGNNLLLVPKNNK